MMSFSDVISIILSNFFDRNRSIRVLILKKRKNRGKENMALNITNVNYIRIEEER